ncbi:MAG: hypothetical protein KJ063_15865 [Anaerolineae bacterium]|nr:hypothetical protein [Anaerolineae bacterium]
MAAFNRLKPQLHQKYSGQVVAIYQGQVIAVGPDKQAVFNEVLAQYGEIICYLEWVEPETPRRVRMPSIHIVREQAMPAYRYDDEQFVPPAPVLEVLVSHVQRPQLPRSYHNGYAYDLFTL